MTPENKPRGPSQATKIVNMVLGNRDIVLFKDEYGTAHVQFPIGDHMEIWPCKSGAFMRWLSSFYYKLTRRKTVPGRESLKDAIGLLEGIAINEREEHRLFNRVAQTPDAIWYDLADSRWRAVRITEDGWSIETKVPLLFRRFSHLASQVEPMAGGSVKDVLRFVNVTNPDQQMLFLVHLVTAFIPGWPHPACYIYGPQGSAKSSFSKVMRRLIDPSKIEVVSLTRHERELEQQLGHHAYLAFDNVSEIPNSIADLLCRAITGSGFSKRELYSDDEDVIRHVMANVCINGINIASNRADLLERSLLIGLERIPKGHHKQEHDLMAEFEAARPKILGAIFDAVSQAMKLRPHIQVNELPRMADFAIYGCAVAEALGYGMKAFLQAYSRNINSQSEEVVQDNVVAVLIMALLDKEYGEWNGMPTELLKRLKDLAMDAMIVDKQLPENPSALMREVNRLKTALEEVGMQVMSHNDRSVTIRRMAEKRVSDS